MAFPQYPNLLELLLVNPWRPPELVERRVSSQLRRLIPYVYERIPFYRETWRAAGFDPRDFRGVRDLARVPFVDKNMIVDAGETARDHRTPRAKLRDMHTSGTSGRSIHVQRTRPEERQTRRSVLRQLWCIGANLVPTPCFVTLASPWMQARRGAVIQALARTRHLPATASFDEQIEALRTLRPDGVMGQTGAVYLLAREVLRRGLHFPVRFVVPTGATLVEEMRRTIAAAFGTQPCDMYGAIEVGVISWQCQRGNYHIDADRIVVEIVDEAGRLLPPGQPGQVVITALFNYHMPFIRYRLLDVAALSTQACGCGVRFPLMAPVQGRMNDFLPTPQGDLVSPHFIFHIFDGAGKNPVKDWRLTQEELSRLVYEYVPEDAFDPAAFEHGMTQLRRRFGPRCQIEVRRVEHVPPTPGGKRMNIVSKLRPPEMTFGTAWVGQLTPRWSAAAGDVATIPPPGAGAPGLAQTTETSS